jgi:DNA polymerase-3 subunit gamma/tau
MSPELIVEHLKHVLEQEMVAFDEPALWLLGRSADGSMRDALSLTDQAIAFGSGKLSDEDVRSMLGTIDRTAVFELLEALASSDGAEVLAAIEKMAGQAPDYSGALEELLSLLHRVAIAQAVPGASDNSQGDQQRVAALAASVPAEDIQLFYQMALIGRRDLPMAPDPRSGFEMVLLRMLAFRPAGIPELPRETLGSVPAAAAPVSGQAGLEAQQPVKKPEAARQAVARPPVQPIAKAEPAVATKVTVTSSPRVVDRVAEAKTQAVARAQSAAQVQAAASTEVEQQPPVIPPELAREAFPVESGMELAELTPANWSASFEQLGFGGVVGNIASHCVLQRVDHDSLHFVIDQANATLFNDSYLERIQDQLSKALSQQLKVTITIGPVQVETPAALKSRMLAESKQHALDSLNSDANVRCLIEEFGATLNPESVAPIH